MTEWAEEREECRECGAVSYGDYVTGSGLCWECERKNLDAHNKDKLLDEIEE